jgi:hypothetical protein
MITYAERVCFRSEHMKLLAAAELSVSRVAKTWGNELRCHELARAVHVVLDEKISKLVATCALRVVDGKCGPVEHSWLRTGTGIVLDPYVPGRLPAVQILDPLLAVMYRSGPSRTDIRQEVVDQLIHEMRSPARRASAAEKS